ncbi:MULTISPECIES: hypothetical protein [unclassified Cryobacterium]|uniref:hypothetical protein n=1 Tax=unclassified Cryobacterium TaxID=2649013 RepID=UPI002AB5758A|nr:MULTISPECIES: hypothetical protein [unclassified Cryobacterium]MDY7542602.1 hypothetical protein [Cryobacterium sp. 5B3]MEB0264722.1 hypothetical protein [Cryobacterium sp. 10I5]MEB0273694.1 hypothetical protein [Cryobacterium sp. 5B3]
MAGIQVTVDIITNLDGAIASLLLGAVKGQNVAAERLLALASAEAPLDSNGGGTLVASGTTVPATVLGDDTLVVFDTPYAARWHEDGELVDNLGRHYSGGSNFQNGRKSHYLSDPALQNKAELGEIVGAEAGRG